MGPATKLAEHGCAMEIFYENANSQQNTVNGSFPLRAFRPQASTTKDGQELGVGFAAVHSFPPCITRAYDGIFRRGGGSPGTVSKTSRIKLPDRKELVTRGEAPCADG